MDKHSGEVSSESILQHDIRTPRRSNSHSTSKLVLHEYNRKSETIIHVESHGSRTFTTKIQNPRTSLTKMNSVISVTSSTHSNSKVQVKGYRNLNSVENQNSVKKSSYRTVYLMLLVVVLSLGFATVGTWLISGNAPLFW